MYKMRIKATCKMVIFFKKDGFKERFYPSIIGFLNKEKHKKFKG